MNTDTICAPDVDWVVHLTTDIAAHELGRCTEVLLDCPFDVFAGADEWAPTLHVSVFLSEPSRDPASLAAPVAACVDELERRDIVVTGVSPDLVYVGDIAQRCGWRWTVVNARLNGHWHSGRRPSPVQRVRRWPRYRTVFVWDWTDIDEWLATVKPDHVREPQTPRAAECSTLWRHITDARRQHV